MSCEGKKIIRKKKKTKPEAVTVATDLENQNIYFFYILNSSDVNKYSSGGDQENNQWFIIQMPEIKI